MHPLPPPSTQLVYALSEFSNLAAARFMAFSALRAISSFDGPDLPPPPEETALLPPLEPPPRWLLPPLAFFFALTLQVPFRR